MHYEFEYVRGLPIFFVIFREREELTTVHYITGTLHIFNVALVKKLLGTQIKAQITTKVQKDRTV